MTTLKLITTVNWILISIYRAFVFWALLQRANPYNDAGGGEQEVAIKGIGVFLLLALMGLNLLSYQWTKIMALMLLVLLLLLIQYISTH